ncbi:fluoride efflux transporter CrcB [Thermogemmatispora carboxidivorans]|uniref:fluoride efflux transporter CrcB n=1 Tax=Thermogemmatispora carboxidivorans TaxID=1382306 RepID=UPI00069A307A|nr:fluoride efflux transporter CrcB [Thermogemmatispora carboxidivorans]
MAQRLSTRRRLGMVALGGFCGTLARAWLSPLLQACFGKSWPYDILLINLSGAFALALVTVLAEATFLIGPTRRLLITVGFLGAYTTFSSLALGDVLLLAAGRWLAAALYLLVSLVGGIAAVLLGQWLGGRCLALRGWWRARRRQRLRREARPADLQAIPAQSTVGQAAAEPVAELPTPPPGEKQAQASRQGEEGWP